MCGIFGSFNFRRFETLYTTNKQRGTFSFGSFYVGKTLNPGMARETYTRKREGWVDLTGDYAFQKDYEQFLGHTQAPTGIQRDYSPVTTHPFNSVHFVVAHNGVLENTKELIEGYIGDHDNPVDSSVIPIVMSYMLEFNEEFYENGDPDINPEVMAIQTTCNILKGTFACWIYSKITGNSYLVRSGSTLFGNILTGDFSSTKHDIVCEEELKQGVIYCVTEEGLATCGTFKSNSPFFL